jgi:antitoxin component YwqK of YwqJK toxin-antitoxin module
VITPANPLKRVLALAGIVAAVAAGLWMVWPERSAPQPSPREADLSDLILREERMYLAGESGPFTGIMVERYGPGEVRSRSALAGGVLHGLSEGWHTNGVLQVREYFRDGVSHGLRTKWGPDGQKLSEATIEQGRITGTFRRWHSNGALAEEIEMVDNEPRGLSRAYYSSGGLKLQARVENGVVLERQSWEESEAPQVAAELGTR